MTYFLCSNSLAAGGVVTSPPSYASGADGLQEGLYTTIPADSPEQALLLYRTHLYTTPPVDKPPTGEFKMVAFVPNALGPPYRSASESREAQLQSPRDAFGAPYLVAGASMVDFHAPGRETYLGRNPHDAGRAQRIIADSLDGARDYHRFHIENYPRDTRQGEPGVSTLIPLSLFKDDALVASDFVDHAEPGSDLVLPMLHKARNNTVIDFTHEVGGFQITGDDWTEDTTEREISRYISYVYGGAGSYEGRQASVDFWRDAVDSLGRVNAHLDAAIALVSDQWELPSEPGDSRPGYDSASMHAVTCLVEDAAGELEDYCRMPPPAHEFLIGWAEGNLTERDLAMFRATAFGIDPELVSEPHARSDSLGPAHE